jgi:hypothetical protein
MELDHFFVLTSPGAPEAERLIELGLIEGPPNRHPGQGTANRRFAFASTMIELLWVSDADEAKNDRTAPTMLWERWLGRRGVASPFGICLRPSCDGVVEPPFPGWKYRPEYLPDPLFIHVGEGSIEEPFWAFLDFMRKSARKGQSVEHPAGMREITGLVLVTPAPIRSPAGRTLIKSGILQTRPGDQSVLEIEFDNGAGNRTADLRPELPMTFTF